MFRFPSVICTRCTGFFCLAIIKGPPNDIYCIIEEPYKHYFTEKVSYSQPIGYIVNYDSFIAILGMFGSSNNHFRISISNLKPRKAFSLKCLLPGNVVADLNIKLLVASLSNKVDFLLIELADINII